MYIDNNSRGSVRHTVGALICVPYAFGACLKIACGPTEMAKLQYWLKILAATLAHRHSSC